MSSHGLWGKGKCLYPLGFLLGAESLQQLLMEASSGREGERGPWRGHGKDTEYSVAMFSLQFWVDSGTTYPAALKQHGVLSVMKDAGRKDGGLHLCLESTSPLSPLILSLFPYP